jgi:5-formyltetrahydrofolate cyclo-ligase
MSPKRALRHATRIHRDSLHVDDRHRHARIIKKHLFEQDEYREARAVMFYAAFGSEVPTSEIIESALRDGKVVVLPIADMQSNNLVLRKIRDLTHLKESEYGIPEPVIEHTDDFVAENIDLVIVPGIAFDEEGSRIGYGGGFYDRFMQLLSPNVPLLSIAFELQVVPKIPSESHDLPVDKIITEKRIIDARNTRDAR